jgi:hypothetical protein
MTFLEFCNIKFYTANYVVVPIKNKLIKTLKNNFYNERLKYDKDKELQWLRAMYEKHIKK